MEPSSVETDKIGQEFDGDACEFCERYKNRGLSRSSKLLLRFILDNNVMDRSILDLGCGAGGLSFENRRSEEHTSELQSHSDLVCRLLLEKKKIKLQKQ